MCLIGIAWQAHPDFPLIVAANRDEYHARPTAAAAWWPDVNGLFGGRDLQSGGTWMGVTRHGRFAALTNFRDAGQAKPGAPSRGALVANFLTGTAAPQAYTSACVAAGSDYQGFNLLTATPDTLCYGGNCGAAAQVLAPGIYALSNALLDTPWPKVISLKMALGAALNDYTACEAHLPRVSDLESCELFLSAPSARSAPRWAAPPSGAQEPSTQQHDAPHSERIRTLFEALFVALGDATPRPDHTLPDTGIPLERERMLSSPMIISPVYGTRASTVMCLSRSGQIQWEERSLAADGSALGTVREYFNLPARPGNARTH